MERTEEGTFEIVIRSKVKKQLKKVPRYILERFSIFLEILKRNPLPFDLFDIKKIKGANRVYRVRIGRYRVIYHVDVLEMKIVILEFATREKAYSRR